MRVCYNVTSVYNQAHVLAGILKWNRIIRSDTYNVVLWKIYSFKLTLEKVRYIMYLIGLLSQLHPTYDVG